MLWANLRIDEFTDSTLLLSQVSRLSFSDGSSLLLLDVVCRTHSRSFRVVREIEAYLPMIFEQEGNYGFVYNIILNLMESEHVLTTKESGKEISYREHSFLSSTVGTVCF